MDVRIAFTVRLEREKTKRSQRLIEDAVATDDFCARLERMLKAGGLLATAASVTKVSVLSWETDNKEQK